MRYLLILCLFLCSCQSSVDQRSEVMKIHDEAMARMGEIHLAVTALEEKLSTSADSTKIQAVIDELNSAEEGMMVWMQEYKEPESNLESFYQSEKEKIIIVSQDIDKSLSNAEKFIEK